MKNKRFYTIVITLLLSCIIQLNAQQRIDHMVWDQLLLLNVSSEGEVDYKGFIRDKFLFDQYFNSLATNYPDDSYSREEQLAYWINLYNAVVMKMIIDNYPVSSINDIKNPWKQKAITIKGKGYSLDDIEHGMLRKMNEPKIHFLLNCAAKSSPRLWNRAYTGDNINKELNEQTKAYINDTRKNLITAEEVKLSQVFEWYKDDFNRGDVISYINQFVDTKIPKKTKISFLPYDWGLYERN